ncbi:MAG: hypothetical protein GWN01_15215 [Nitrosopumilaceae archaeon]|nr:hypothetical protein [Nitrosopumilaceae archaeon]NIU02193.1 hypothetical protein [Nitrosopumilaceae archaeon]NIU88665.1 hypothetical protein [Nitrosopumilaceae archaeon]NIV66815.1 hypothetical protein [Nitrosopumilaceae archaeon]NIX62794.1 hypothetical protein [Nitrosopumilaceae archaeon]
MKKQIGIIAVGLAIASVLSVVIFSNTVDPGIMEKSSDQGILNPFQTYEINTKCELAYLALDSIETLDTPFPVDKEVLQSNIYTYKKQIQEMSQEGSTSMDEGGDILKKGRKIVTDHVMQHNAINPKLRSSVDLILNKALSTQTPQEKIDALNTMFLIDLEPYKEDPECGKRFHETFGAQTFEALEGLYGEEGAQKKYQEIKDAIY